MTIGTRLAWPAQAQGPIGPLRMLRMACADWLRRAAHGLRMAAHAISAHGLRMYAPAQVSKKTADTSDFPPVNGSFVL